MEGRTRGDFETSALRGPQRIHQLIEEERHTGVDLHLLVRRLRSSSHSLSAARDDLLAVGDDKFVEHDNSPYRLTILRRRSGLVCRKLNSSLNSGPFPAYRPKKKLVVMC
jgi:hypothetical protein